MAQGWLAAQARAFSAVQRPRRLRVRPAAAGPGRPRRREWTDGEEAASDLLAGTFGSSSDISPLRHYALSRPPARTTVTFQPAVSSISTQEIGRPTSSFPGKRFRATPSTSSSSHRLRRRPSRQHPRPADGQCRPPPPVVADIDHGVENRHVPQLGPGRRRRQTGASLDGPRPGVRLDAHEPGRDRPDEGEGDLGVLAALLGRVGERQDPGVRRVVLPVAVEDLRQVGLDLDALGLASRMRRSVASRRAGREKPK